MRRLFGAIKLDLLFQFRSGFHGIYLFLSGVYILIIQQLPKEWLSVVVPLVIFSDPAVLGFFFIGGLLMLEKVQGIVDFVHITPLKKGEFLMSKVISLTLLALIASVSIALLSGSAFNVLLLIISVVLIASFFTMFGFLVALTSRSMNHYFGRVIPAMLLIIIPCFSLIGIPYGQFFYLFPSVSAAKLLMLTFGGGTFLDMVLCTMSMLVWNGLLFLYVTGRFDRYTLVGGGLND